MRRPVWTSAEVVRFVGYGYDRRLHELTDRSNIDIYIYPPQ